MGKRGSKVKYDIFGQEYDVKRVSQSSERMNASGSSAEQSGNSILLEKMGQVDLISKNHGGVETTKYKWHLKIMETVDAQLGQEFRAEVGWRVCKLQTNH